jgi:hypothetical protein
MTSSLVNASACIAVEIIAVDAETREQQRLRSLPSPPPLSSFMFMTRSIR